MGVVSQLVAVHNPSQCFALKTVKGASSINMAVMNETNPPTVV